ncbi:hypothetical protein Lalb_Chr05g0228781 [Lupinus albus]|uniref:Uncharacterized protein n=1 Tax=Lupinus albus TaxID=3870 RepID=A0A6A4QMH2_LUPAL|nr:hypothetical protein Lalb_Chr05g0228781 [Lupinus albus]
MLRFLPSIFYRLQLIVLDIKNTSCHCIWYWRNVRHDCIYLRNRDRGNLGCSNQNIYFRVLSFYTISTGCNLRRR